MAGSNGQGTTNLSSLLSIDFLDDHGNELSIRTSVDDPFRMFIPSDVNWIVPPLVLQNVTSSLNISQSFYLYMINLSQSNNSVSVHIEIYPLNSTLAYMYLQV
jgi:hypothetical protein